jgi:hypothetical protein
VGWPPFGINQIGFQHVSMSATLSIQVVWWNWLDLIIVLSGITEMILPLLGSGHSPLHLSGLRGLRLLRLARLARGLMHGSRD